MRRIDRLRNSCPVDTLAAGAWVVPGRQPEPCSVPVPVPEPEYVTPVAPADVVPATRLPNALLISNARFVLTCADVEGMGPFGPDAIVGEGQVSEILVWTDIPDVTAAQLDYLTTLTDQELQMISADGVATSTLQDLTRLNAVQTGYLYARLQTLRQNVADATRLSAVALLRCVWRSALQQVYCSDPQAARTNQSPQAVATGIVNPGVCLAGSYESQTSQAEADALALAFARSQLVCLVGNDALTRTCQDMGYPTAVPTDLDTVSFNGRRRVGSASIPADAYFANSKNGANEIARRAAESQLSCFYPNAPVQASCGDIDPALAGAGVVPVNYAEQRAGNPVAVDAGTFLAEGAGASQALADSQAMAAAKSQLSCVFFNARQLVRCQPQTIGDKTYPPKDPDREVVVEAGTVTANSQAEADNLARELGLLQLGCIYCNPYIPPSCYPPDYPVAPGAAIPASAVTSAWSPDVVLGVVAGTVCDSDPLQAATVAAAVSLQRPVVPNAGCQYLNDAMWFGCLKELDGALTPPEGGYHHPAYEGNTTPPVGYESVPFEDQLSPLSNPSPKPAAGGLPYLVIPAGSYPINSTDVPDGMSPKAYANNMARLYGLSLLRCAFANPEMQLNCQTAYVPAKFIQVDVAQTDNQVVEVTIPAARHESYFSFREAVESARAEAQALLNCYYENPETRVRCWIEFATPGALPPEAAAESTSQIRVYGDGQARRFWTADGTPHFADVSLQAWQSGSLATPVLVPRGTFTSLTSLADAQQQALLYARASLDCTAAADDTNVCNDSLLMYCGGLVEPNPTAPFQAGGYQVPPDKPWKFNEKGQLVAGDGHNYAYTKAGQLLDLGASTDPVGGVRGTGLIVPPCLVSAATKDEANRLAYMLMRPQLSCVGTANPPNVGGGQQGPAGADGSDAAQTGCEGSCLAVYSD